MTAPHDDARKPSLRGLSDLAAAVARDLDCAVVITTHTAREPQPAVAAAAVLDRASADRLLPGLALLERELGNESVLTIASVADHEPSLAENGVVSAAAVRIELEGEGVGAIHVLRNEPGVPINDGLLRAYASHAAVTISGARTPHSGLDPEVAMRIAAELAALPSSLRAYTGLMEGLDAALKPLLAGVRSGIMIWDDSRDILQMLPGSFGADERTSASYQVVTLNSFSNAARVFTTGDPYLSNRASGDAAILQEYVEAFGISRLLSLRLDFDGLRLGVLHLANKRRDFTVRDIWHLEPLLPHIAAAVEITGKLMQLRRRQRLEGILSDVAVAVAAGQSMQDFLSPALDELCVAMGASVVALVPTTSEPIVWRSGDVLAEREAQMIAQAKQHPPRRADVVGPLKAGDPGSSGFYVPVYLGGQRVGTLATLRMRAEPFAGDEQRALGRLARLAALAWATERYQQQRAQLARIEERQRIADDLHDDVAQILFGAQISVDAALERVSDDKRLADTLIRTQALLIKADEAIRTVISQLSRPVAEDLTTDLIDLVSSIEAEFDLPIHLEMTDDAKRASAALGSPRREALLKVAREALVNAAKHAGPCRAALRLHIAENGALAMSIVDDGIGIPSEAASGRHGLTSLRRIVRSHGGELRIRAADTGGTKVSASFPL